MSEDKYDITTHTVESLVKVHWRLRLKWWWVNRKLRRQADLVKHLQEEEHYLLLYGACPRSGDACRGNCDSRCDPGLF